MQPNLPCLLLILLAVSPLVAQPSLNSFTPKARQNINQWMETSPFSGIINLEGTTVEDDKLVLKAHLLDDFLRWDSLTQKMAYSSQTPQEQLMIKLSEQTNLPLRDLKIHLISESGEVIVVIILADGQVVQQRFTDQVYVPETRSGFFIPKYSNFDPREFFSLDFPLDTSQYLMNELVQDFFEKEINAYEVEFDKIIDSRGFSEYLIEGRGFVTKRYFERIELRVWRIPVGGRESEMYYELRAFYASGLLQPGEYKASKLDYFSELIIFNNRLKNRVLEQFY